MPQLIRFFCVVAFALSIAVPARAADIIGEIRGYTIQEGDVFVDIVRKYDLGYNELRAANPRVDAWIPKVGSNIALPLAHILPDAPRRGIVINLADQRLYYFAPGGDIHAFPIGVVKEGLIMPQGPGRIIAKREHPSWTPPASVRKEKPNLPAVVPPGPNNPLGDYALYANWENIRIHGTNKPMGVGRRVSHGCIRLYPEDIKWLFDHTAIGTTLTVVDQPVKVGWRGDKLYLEVNPRMQDADAVEFNGYPPPLSGNDDFLDQVTALVLKAAKDRAQNINWALIGRLAEARDGLPHEIMQKSNRPEPTVQQTSDGE